MGIPTLLPGQEFEALSAVSEGLENLCNETDAVFLDTSFLCHGIATLDTFGIRGFQKYKGTKKDRFDFFSLRALLHAISTGDETDISLKQVRELMDENLLRVDLLLGTVEEKLTQGKLYLPERAYEESSDIHRSSKIGVYLLSPKTRRKKARKSANRRQRTERGAQYAVMGTLKRVYIDTPITAELTRHIKKRITNLSAILTQFDRDQRIVPSSALYLGDRGEPLHDHQIIDSALSFSEEADSVGIITYDQGFLHKVGEVIGHRSSAELESPSVVRLVIGRMGLTKYEGYLWETVNKEAQQLHQVI